ncbi:helicase-related protein [Microbacterium sp.]|uniref:helicase-related protein n=1 Tax=Microbacterium sp. TaxID=51671 RepID=UPI0025E404CC|nr:helicase-related protein [Microbacterium sp.]
MTPHIASQLAAIELAYALTDGHTPTEAERAVLAGFTGWGQLAKAFDAAPEGQWAEAADRLDAAVPAAALAAARDQVDTSFFTSPVVTSAVWDILTAAGFTGGRILEPGCGAGAFMTTTPAGIDAQWTGVEIDPTSARIARLVNPEAEIIEGPLQKTPLRDGHFDAAIGNVPFSDVRVYDSEDRGGALHNYFAWRAVDAVRPGGYIILVTSRYGMDAKEGIIRSLREWTGAALVGAVRLPSGAFADAGTAAVTDIIVIRKNDALTHLPGYAGEPDFEHISDGWGYYGRGYREIDHRHEITDRTASAPEGATVKVSRYWAANPSHVAGRMLATGFDRAPLVVESADVAADVRAAVTALTATLPAMGERHANAAAADDLSDVVLADADGRKEGSFHVIDGAMFRVASGKLEPVRNSKELAALVAIRDVAANLLRLESDTSLPDAAIDDARTAARASYEAYVKAFGHLNRGTLVEGAIDEETGLPALSWRRPVMGGFRRDPDSALVMALEVFDQETGEAAPAPILLRRVNHAPVPATSADTAAEALAISLGESGRVDLDRIGGLLGLDDRADTLDALGDLVFLVDGQWQGAHEALSGNVRAKHAAASDAAARGDEHAARYAAALEQVIPAYLGPAEISITLGSPFVTADDITTFLKDVLGARWPRVAHTPSQAVWEVDDSSYEPSLAMQWGVPDMTPGKLVECALNNKLPEITDREWNPARRDWRNVRNPQKSAAAAAKLELIRDRFSVWVWEDADRAERIVREYNDKLNSHITRVFDGSGLTFPGMAEGFTPWPHQRAAVERIVSTERALIGHPVGAGKTASMIAGARTLRQFGLAQKPMIVVPNHLLDQIAREAQQMFPTGRFLIASKDDLARDARRLFAARCATGEWDAVIITHQSFGSIPVRPDIEEAWIGEQKHALRWALQAEGNQKSKGAKAIARAVRSLDARIAKLRDGKNDLDAIFFDQLGVDYLMVDEAHMFRRLDTQSQARDNGMGSGSSKRATDLLMKVETLADRRPGKPVASFFTGTPWSNTLAETWVWQRYLQPETLDEIGLLQFDAWVSAFIRYEHNIEVAPDGSGFRMYRRPVGVVNAPELKMLLSQVADIMDPAQLGLARPDFDVVNVTVEATPGQREFVRDLADRADAIRNGSSRTAEDRSRPDDNMLLICNDGRKVALDPQLAGVDEQSAKIAKAAEMIADAYHLGADRTFGSHATPGAFQLAFMDLGTPHPGDSQTYGRLRRLLVDRGVPAQQVRFVHEATTDKARAALFASCRDGDVAVLIASTAKAGMGTNIQTRLTHLWHIDAPWLPSDVIQRDGRAVRPGNLSGHVTITRLVTEGTFDAYMWQALERKSRAFEALYATGATAREIEDVSGATMSYGEVKALASGNPLLLDQAKVRAEVKQLQVLRAMHLQGVNQARSHARNEREIAETARRRQSALLEARTTVTAADADERVAALGRASSAVEAMWHADGAGSNAYYASRFGYRGVTVKLADRDRKLPFVRVQLMSDYTPFAEITLSNGDVRKNAAKVAELVIERVDSILGDLDRRIRSEGETVERAAAAAVQLDAAAESAVFEQQAELEDAVIRLAEIDAAIAEDAAEPVAA